MPKRIHETRKYTKTYLTPLKELKELEELSGVRLFCSDFKLCDLRFCRQEQGLVVLERKAPPFTGADMVVPATKDHRSVIHTRYATT